MLPAPDPSVVLQDVLFHELHHRFFNSLQLLSAMLGRLADGHERPDEVRGLQDRIGLLGCLHRTLSLPPAGTVDMQTAFGTLCATLTDGFDRREVILTVDGSTPPDDPLAVRVLTLILVELVTNALKHSPANSAAIRVILDTSSSLCRLTVANAAPQAGAPRPSPYVATRLTEALGGSLNIAVGRDYVVCVTIPARRRLQ